MAKLVSTTKFTGSLGVLSAYRMRGSDEIILRRKGGPSRKKVLTAPSFVNTRRNMMEFSGRSTAAKQIMLAMHPLKPLADYNIAGPLNALLRHAQRLDPVGDWGERSVELSRCRSLLEGFSLNRIHLFDSVVRTPVSCELSRDTRSARVSVPALVPGINFIPDSRKPYYSLIITLGFVPDLFFATEKKRYEPAHESYKNTRCFYKETAWLPTLHRADEVGLDIACEFVPPDQAHNLVLGIGIRYGAVGLNGEIEQVRHTGSAKILMVV